MKLTRALLAVFSLTILASPVLAQPAGSWTQIGGDGLNGSWGPAGNEVAVGTMATDGVYLYAAIRVGGAPTDSVWQYDGAIWTQIAGDGLNGSWAEPPSNIYAMVAHDCRLYVGTSWTNGEPRVWQYDGSGWVQVGGDGIAGSWQLGANGQAVASLVSHSGLLYAGLEGDGGPDDPDLWQYDGAIWTQIAGDGLNGSWQEGYFSVTGLATYDGAFYSGLSQTWLPNLPEDFPSSVWQYTGSGWKMVGGQRINNSWLEEKSRINDLLSHQGSLLAAVGGEWSGEDLWQYDGAIWTQIGGDGIAGSWDKYPKEINSLGAYVRDLYAGLGQFVDSFDQAAQVWVLDQDQWYQVGGDGLNGSWEAAGEVNSLVHFQNSLYAGLWLQGGLRSIAEVWEWTRFDQLPAPVVYPEVTGVRVAKVKSESAQAIEITWDDVAAGNWYNIAAGNIADLSADRGFNRAFCLVPRFDSTRFPDFPVGSRWYLVRAQACHWTGSYGQSGAPVNFREELDGPFDPCP